MCYISSQLQRLLNGRSNLYQRLPDHQITTCVKNHLVVCGTTINIFHTVVLQHRVSTVAHIQIIQTIGVIESIIPTRLQKLLLIILITNFDYNHSTKEYHT